MKLRDLERHLLAHGARKVGEGGRHTKWRSADGLRATAVPRHREIGPGLVRAICRQLIIPNPEAKE
jgi:predicted RNA binding protein YcfA (HicA-like mRNA interferase family)